MPNKPIKSVVKHGTRIFGIDPGYERVGIAVIERKNGKEVLLFSDCVRTSSKLEHHSRLEEISRSIEKIIASYDPDILAIEKLFFNTNQKTALLVSEARGVIINVCTKNSISDVREFTPPQIKAAITGDGRADKEQVKKMVRILVGIKNKKLHDDECDAIAIALTCAALN